MQVTSFLGRIRALIARRLHLIYPPKDIRLFCPNSSGSRGAIAELSTLAANDTLFWLTKVASIKQADFGPISIPSFTESIGSSSAAQVSRLKALFDQYGSDKASPHGYHPVYTCILQRLGNCKGLLEIGLGTNNPDIVSHMGRSGRPGASLRAFRDFLPTTPIFGADVDRDILFQEDRIKTYFVDQIAQNGFTTIREQLPRDTIQLVIDDGLHATNANLATLLFGLDILAPDQEGWIVIEDIPARSLEVWQVAATLLQPAGHNCWLVEGAEDYLFILAQNYRNKV